MNEYSFRRPFEVIRQKNNNDIQDEWYSPDMKYCGFLRNPVAIVMLYATLIAMVVINVAGRQEDDGLPENLVNFWGLFILIFNLSFWIANIQACIFHYLILQCPCLCVYIYCYSDIGRISGQKSYKKIMFNYSRMV